MNCHIKVGSYDRGKKVVFRNFDLGVILFTLYVQVDVTRLVEASITKYHTLRSTKNKNKGSIHVGDGARARSDTRYAYTPLRHAAVHSDTRYAHLSAHTPRRTHDTGQTTASRTTPFH